MQDLFLCNNDCHGVSQLNSRPKFCRADRRMSALRRLLRNIWFSDSMNGVIFHINALTLVFPARTVANECILLALPEMLVYWFA